MGVVTHKTYEGPTKTLKGKTALVRPGRASRKMNRRTVLAQFDDIKGLELKYTHGWKEYRAAHFS